MADIEDFAFCFDPFHLHPVLRIYAI
jgi:hypothetical protein